VNVNSALDCSEWLFKIHNEVNVATGKTTIDNYLQIVKWYLPESMYDSIDPSQNELQELKQLTGLKQNTPLNTQIKEDKKSISSLPTVPIILILVFTAVLVSFLFFHSRKKKSFTKECLSGQLSWLSSFSHGIE